MCSRSLRPMTDSGKKTYEPDPKPTGKKKPKKTKRGS